VRLASNLQYLTFTKSMASDSDAALAAGLDPTVRAAQGRLSALNVFHSKSILYGTFVWACRALSCQNRWFLARADRRGPDRRRDHGVSWDAGVCHCRPI
jgi:hypothetical protein